MPHITNPILRGFNPDPSICRAGDDFYIAVSTFEWYPGVFIYHSVNLERWELVSRPLERLSQLNMLGNPSSGGVWAPCLSWSEGRFWLIFSDVKDWAGTAPDFIDGFKDCHNYLITSESITGPWSDPLYLNSSGFDPSLFHDEDGRKWLTNMIWDHRPGRNSFGGIALQEYSVKEQRLVGPIRNIFKGSSIGFTEAPHLYRRGGWYYLMTAEGGTSYSHAVTLARSRSLEGPYELHPQQPLLSSNRDIPGYEQACVQGEPLSTLKRYLRPGLQKAGHGSMVPWTDEQWVLAHLCGRPIGDTLYCPLGRETALQKLVWKDDHWPYPVEDGPQSTVELPSRPGCSKTAPPVETEPIRWREDFDADSWDPHLQTLRVPADQRFDVKARPGWLRLHGAESPVSRFSQSLLARRVQSFDWSAETLVDFVPQDFQQFAGLSVRYDERTQLLLRISDLDGQRVLGILSLDQNRLELPLGTDEIVLPDGPVYLGVDMSDEKISFRWSPDGLAWFSVGPVFDAWKLSDEYAEPMGFTGMFVGICCYDISGRRAPADFDFLSYREHNV